MPRQLIETGTMKPVTPLSTGRAPPEKSLRGSWKDWIHARDCQSRQSDVRMLCICFPPACRLFLVELWHAQAYVRWVKCESRRDVIGR